MKTLLLAGALAACLLPRPVVAGEIVQRVGERPREMSDVCSRHPEDRYYGIFTGIAQKGLQRDQTIAEGGCFATREACESWLYNIHSDHSAGEQQAGCKPRS